MAYTTDVSMFPYWTRDDATELYDLREFKNQAEDTCASHVVMDDLMKQVASLQQQLKHVKNIAKQKQKEISELKEELAEVPDDWDEMACILQNEGIYKCECCRDWTHREMYHVHRADGTMEQWCQDCHDGETMECEECGDLCQNDEISQWSPEGAAVDENGMPEGAKDVCFACERTLNGEE